MPPLGLLIISITFSAMQRYCKEYFENSFALKQTQSFSHTHMQPFKKCLIPFTAELAFLIPWHRNADIDLLYSILHFQNNLAIQSWGEGKGREGNVLLLRFPLSYCCKKKQ